MNAHLPYAFRTTLKSHLFMYENLCGPVQALAEFRSIDFPSPLLFITEEYQAPIEVFPEKQESAFNKRREKAIWLSSWNYLIAFINSSVNKCKRGVRLLVKNQKRLWGATEEKQGRVIGNLTLLYSAFIRHSGNTVQGPPTVITLPDLRPLPSLQKSRPEPSVFSSADTEANYKISQEIINVTLQSTRVMQDKQEAHNLVMVLCVRYILVFNYPPTQEWIEIIHYCDVYSIPGGLFIRGRSISVWATV